MDHDGLFLFLEPNADPAGGGSTLPVWAPDADSAR